MTRAARRLAPAALAFVAGCAGPYEDPDASTYIIGGIFVVLGVILGVALIMSLNEG